MGIGGAPGVQVEYRLLCQERIMFLKLSNIVREVNKRSDKIDCTSFISLFLSLRITAAAMQMPGLCVSPTLVLFW